MIFAYLKSPYFIIKNLQAEALKKYSCQLKGMTLDVGCGGRLYRKYLPAGNPYVGMDISAAAKPDVLGKAQDVPFSDGCFESVLCTEVLEHLPEPEKAVCEIRRVLKKDGFLYLTVPQAWPLHYEPEDYLRFTSYGIRGLLEKNGFGIIAIERIGGVFSLIGQRIIDVVWQIEVNCLKMVFGPRWAERIATALCLVFSMFFYIAGKFGDRIEEKDAIGWAVLAVKL